MYGGSTGGWKRLLRRSFPEEYNGAWCACPTRSMFRAYTVVNIYHTKMLTTRKPW